MKTEPLKQIFTAFVLLVFSAVGTKQVAAADNSQSVISPYWQSDSTSYSFIAVSHPSLSNMASQIGLTLSAIQNDQSTFGTAISFTISSGSTERVFIVGTNDPTFNPTNIPTAQFIAGSTDFKHGHLLIEPVATNPGVKPSSNDGDGFRDVTTLMFWGSVVIESTTTGFAMEFIGDLHNSIRAIGTSATIGVSGVGGH